MSANRFADTLGKLQQMKPWDVPLDPNVTNHIVTLYNSIHGEGGECFAERESRYINRMMSTTRTNGTSPPSPYFSHSSTSPSRISPSNPAHRQYAISSTVARR